MPTKKDYAIKHRIRNRKKFEKSPPKVGDWVCQYSGSDRYGHKIQEVSEDKKTIVLENGKTLYLNKYYIWVTSRRKIKERARFGYSLAGPEDPTYLDPSF